MSVEKNSVSIRNSSTRPIANGDSFVGGWEDALHYDTLSITLSASANCTLQIAQSVDGSNLDFTEAIGYVTGASISVSRPLTSKYFRVSVLADSGAIATVGLQTIMRLVPAMPVAIAVEPGTAPLATIASPGLAYRNIDVQPTGSLIKSGSTELLSVFASNENGADIYLKLYNTVAAPTQTDTPIWVIRVNSNGSRDLSMPCPLLFPLGLGIRATTGVADNSTAAPGANHVIVSIIYR